MADGHRSSEDYLEAILMIRQAKGSCRSVDVAAHLGFSKPSVSVAVSKLEDSGCVKRMDDYLWLIERAREKTYPVTVRFGLEICYFREYEDLIASLTRGRGFDFLLGSVHFVGDFAFDHKAEHWAGKDVDGIYRRYFEDEISLAESGLFDGIGHPDTIGLFGHRPSFPLTEHYERLAASLAKNGMYADQNSGAYRRCPGTARLGMDGELIGILKRHGVEIITSSDAHCPEDVGYKIRELNWILSKQ